MGRLGRAVLGEGLRLPLRLLASLLAHAAWLLESEAGGGESKGDSLRATADLDFQPLLTLAGLEINGKGNWLLKERE